MIYYTNMPSPVGILTIACTDAGIIGIWIAGQRYFPETENFCNNPNHPNIIQACQWLNAYFSGLKPDPAKLPLCPEGTSFQKTVWNHLLEIPYGAVVTYGELAKQLRCRSAQAVGSAVGRNPISIIVPCHRVIGADGSLTGYAGGLSAKAYLFNLEGFQNHKLDPNN